MTKSETLSATHIEYRKSYKNLNENTSKNENLLKECMSKIFKKLQDKNPTYKFEYTKKIENPLVPGYIKPDGGMISIIINGEQIPLLISEDKIQGTNDKRFKQNKKKQALGNGIERFAKNMNFCNLLCNNGVFPYVLFASGCDFHHTESISNRLVQGNFGKKNHYIECKTYKNTNDYKEDLKCILEEIDIREELINKSLLKRATCCIKSHKYDEMEHGSSAWNKKEIKKILRTVLKQSINNLELNIIF